MTIYTIGHSNHTWDRFAGLLRQHGVQVLVDIRTNPVSRYAPFARQRALPGLLAQEDIRYLYMGASLGGKPADSSCYDSDGKPDYDRISSKPFFQNGVSELLKLAGDFTLALMCAEEDPTKCHRTLLVGIELERHGVKPLHIRKDGSVHGSEKLGSDAAYGSRLQAEPDLE